MQFYKYIWHILNHVCVLHFSEIHTWYVIDGERCLIAGDQGAQTVKDFQQTESILSICETFLP